VNDETTPDAVNHVRAHSVSEHPFAEHDTDAPHPVDDVPPEAPVEPPEATNGTTPTSDAAANPAQLREAAELLFDQSKELKQRGSAQLAEADRLEAEQAAQRAAQERAHRYLVAYEEARTTLAGAERDYAEVEAAVERARQDLAEQELLHAEAEANVVNRRAAYQAAVARGASLNQREECRLGQAAAEAVVPDYVSAVEAARRVVQSQEEGLAQQTEAVRQCWRELERLEATTGMQRPCCLPPPPAPRYDLSKLTPEQLLQALFVVVSAAKWQQEEEERERAFRRGVARTLLLPGEAAPVRLR